ncbi:DUF2239 family protein [Noviherbaspirillum sp. 17J57-3]|uniref:DUF2239 family protein n=2 Tax=Noviherbaspirillum galbum TaxID=2709383 RepID=A0A6B3SZX2_9BURK|nr:DUF2239 family protein [Noviherbaspirillum galbum]
MESQVQKTYTAFCGAQSVASGALSQVAVALCRKLKEDPHVLPLVFDDDTGKQVELDLRGTVAEVEARYADKQPSTQPASSEQDAPAKGRGRPRLGVVAREVTLLPEHWEWLASQPGGASVVLRKLVHEARQANSTRDLQRRRDERVYNAMLVLAGDLPNFEEASRALFAGELDRLERLATEWPDDIGRYLMRLASPETAPAKSGK